MNEIKLNLSIVLPGSTLFSKEECLKTTQEVIKLKNGKKRTVTKVVEDWDKMDKHTFKVSESGKAKPETIVFHTRKCKPATQSINLNKNAFDYMTRGECPSFAKPKDWARMSKKQKLEAHLSKIVEHVGGVSFTYQVFED